MRFVSLALLAACAFTLAACVTARERYLDDGYRFLTGTEVKQLVSGNTVEGRYINRSGTWSDYHDPSGTVTSVDQGSGYIGSWEIDGDEICYSYADEPIRNCLEVAEKSGSYVHFLANGPYSGNLGGDWISVTPGNVKSLPVE